MKRRIVIEITEKDTQDFLSEILNAAAKVIRLHPEATFNVKQEMLPEPKQEISIPGISIGEIHCKEATEKLDKRGVLNG